MVKDLETTTHVGGAERPEGSGAMGRGTVISHVACVGRGVLNLYGSEKQNVFSPAHRPHPRSTAQWFVTNITVITKTSICRKNKLKWWSKLGWIFEGENNSFLSSISKLPLSFPPSVSRSLLTQFPLSGVSSLLLLLYPVTSHLFSKLDTSSRKPSLISRQS